MLYDIKMDTRDTDCPIVTLNFRGTTVRFEQILLNKLPDDSEFNRYLKSKYGLTKSTLANINHPNGQQPQPPLINRSVYLFNHILDYLEHGELHFPHCTCVDTIERELRFWGITHCQLAQCCLDKLLQQKDDKQIKTNISEKWLCLQKQETLAHRGAVSDNVEGGEVLGNRTNDVAIVTKDGGSSAEMKCDLFRPQSKCAKLHEILNNPGSCVVSKIITGVIITAIILSVLVLSLETEPVARDPSYTSLTDQYNQTDGLNKYLYINSSPENWIIYVDFVLAAILTLDLILRFAFNKNKVMFMRHWLTIIDILGVVPVWVLIGLHIYHKITNGNIDYLMKHAYYIGLFRALRIFRLCHITLYCKKLRVVALALRCSWRELLIMFALVGLFAVLFGIAMFYVEIWEEDTFLTIFEAQWWAVVTMTTVGYGDFYPKSNLGRFVGILCSLTGIVVVAMATSVLVNNFLTVYRTVERIERVETISTIKRKSNKELYIKHNCIN